MGSRTEEVVESREFLAAVDRALGRLPLDYRTAVTLRDLEGLSTAEAAHVLGIGERALKSRVRRPRATRAVTRHSRICPNCRRMLTNLARAVAGLRALRDLPDGSEQS